MHVSKTMSICRRANYHLAFPLGGSESFLLISPTIGLTSRCKQYSATKYEYRDFIKLSDIRDSRPPGYQVRLVFYAQATRNAHVLLSRTPTPELATEPVYEFGE